MSVETKPPIVEALRQLAALESTPPTPLTADQISTLLSDQLSSQTRLDLERCLARDPASSPLLRDLRLPPSEDEPLDLGDEEIEAQWLRLRAALPEASPKPPPAESPRGVAWIPRLALAATLILAIGLGGWIRSLYDEVERFSGPRANIEVVSLIPESPVRSAALGRRTAWSGDRALLIFNVSGPLPYESFRLELIPPEPSSPVSVEGLMRHPASRNFTVELPTTLLQPGRSRFVLSGLEPGGWKAIANYDLRLEAPSP